MLFVALLFSTSYAAVVVNEVATSGSTSDICNDEDFVELFNNGVSAATLTGLVLTDDNVRVLPHTHHSTH